ncbi:MAG TPA: hypothetical protein VM487_06940 [Phycisphaerae bacterium]|nr:hypothetical protein [Phycisphaerae bacterium]
MNQPNLGILLAAFGVDDGGDTCCEDSSPTITGCAITKNGVAGGWAT